MSIDVAKLSTEKFNAKILFFASLPLVILLPFLQLKPAITLLAVTLYYIAFMLFLLPEIGLLSLILARPIFDFFSNEKILLAGNLSVNLSAIVAVLVILSSIYVCAKNHARFKSLPFLGLIGIFLSVTFISNIFSIDKLSSFSEWLRLLSIFSIYCLGFIVFDSEEKIKKLIRFIIYSSIIPSIFALYQYLNDSGLSVPLEGIYNRIYGTFAHPNLFAYYLLIPIILIIYLSFMKKDDKRIIFYHLLLLFFLVLLALTYTRGAWLALIITLSIIGAFEYRKLLLILFCTVFFLYLAAAPIQENVNELLFKRQTSIDWRISLWSDSIDYTLEKPLIGQGTGVANEFILKKRGEIFGSSDPHNDYLKIMIENGFLGLIAYLSVIISLIHRLAAVYFKSRNQEIKNLALFISALTVSLYIMSFADNIIRNTTLQWTFWLLLGSFFSYLMIQDKKQDI